MRRTIALADVVALAVATVVLRRLLLIDIAYVAAALAIFWAGGGYRRRLYYSPWTELPVLVGPSVATAVIALMWPTSGRMTVIEQIAGAVVLVLGTRLLVVVGLQFVRSRSATREDALIVGAGEVGVMVADLLRGNRRCLVRPVGFIDRRNAGIVNRLPVVGDFDHVDKAIDELRVKHLIVADPAARQASAAGVDSRGRDRDIDVWVVPPLVQYDAGPSHLPPDERRSVPFHHVPRPNRHSAARLVKRGFDVAVASVALVVTAPLHLAVALLVRLASPGPVYFRQLRIGQGGRPFELLKFRTMTVNDDSDTTWSVHNDRRVTSVGRFLRRSCLDEVPQLLNVIRGDMSLVGPRPERPFFASTFSESVPDYAERLRVPVGMTGWSQIYGLRGNTCIAQRTRFDNFYIDHWSFRLDLIIMARTVSGILRSVLVGERAAAAAVTDLSFEAAILAEAISLSVSKIPSS
jgi:exopolysaccharide biosynthesis polyprenyl glycosylphosphotransferase